MLRHEPIRDELRQLRESYISVTGVVIIFLVEAQEQLHYSSLLPINDFRVDINTVLRKTDGALNTSSCLLFCSVHSGRDWPLTQPKFI